MTKTPEDWIRQAVDMAVQNVRFQHGGPFGAIVVKEGQLVGSGVNSVTAMNDPTAHAEVLAIRAACQNLGAYQLNGCELYTSCEPCPMCLGAIYWSRMERIYFACSRQDAAAGGFDDDFIYSEAAASPESRSIPAVAVLREYGLEAFREWNVSLHKICY